MVLDVGGGVSCAAAVHDGYVLNKPLKKSPLGGDLLTELALKAVSLHDPVPPIQPVYCVKRYGDQPVAHSSYHKYTQLQARRMHGPGACMACAWRVHGACMACAWRVHGVCAALCAARAWRVQAEQLQCMALHSCMPNARALRDALSNALCNTGAPRGQGVRLPL